MRVDGCDVDSLVTGIRAVSGILDVTAHQASGTLLLVFQGICQRIGFWEREVPAQGFQNYTVMHFPTLHNTKAVIERAAQGPEHIFTVLCFLTAIGSRTSSSSQTELSPLNASLPTSPPAPATATRLCPYEFEAPGASNKWNHMVHTVFVSGS
jgi:hypothetical protein